MKKFGLLLFALITGLTVFAQQNTQYSQYMFHGLYINPAYAGYRETINMNAYYRSQWTSIPGSPKTMGLAIDGITNNDKVGLGLNIIHDKLDNERNMSLYANYAYRLRVSADPSQRLSFGLGLGFHNTSWNNDWDSTNPEVISKPNSFLPDARFGVYYSSLTFFAGLSVDNLLSSLIFDKQNDNLGTPPVKQYYLTAGAIVPMASDILFKPSFLLKNAEMGDTRALSLDLNAAFIFAERFTAGVSYRSGLSKKSTLSSNLKLPNAIIGLAEVMVSDQFRIGYSFDYSLNKIQNETGGTHEISLGFILNRQHQRVRTPRYF